MVGKPPPTATLRRDVEVSIGNQASTTSPAPDRLAIWVLGGCLLVVCAGALGLGVWGYRNAGQLVQARGTASAEARLQAAATGTARAELTQATGTAIAAATRTVQAQPNVSAAVAFSTGQFVPAGKYYFGLLTFGADGTWSMSPMSLIGSPISRVSGTYVVDGDRIVLYFRDDGPCAGYPGTYRWSFDGSALFFSQIEDTCPLQLNRDFQRGWLKIP